MSDLILLKVQKYLGELSKGVGTKLEFAVAGKLALAVHSAATRQLSPDLEREFRLRASNLGRPACQLQAEKYKLPREQETYSDRFRALYGHMVEASAVAIMRQAGVRVISEQIGTKLSIGGAEIEGTYDLTIAEPDEKVYDVKSASGWTFKHKYKDGTLLSLWDDGDSLGYVVQLYVYSQSIGKPVGGLIVINKETGEWCIVPPPTDDTELRIKALQRGTNTTKRLNSDEPFKPDYEAIDETFHKKKTGNKILPFVCSMCAYKKNCYPTAEQRPQINSKSANPKLVYYAEIKEQTDGS